MESTSNFRHAYRAKYPTSEMSCLASLATKCDSDSISRRYSINTPDVGSVVFRVRLLWSSTPPTLYFLNHVANEWNASKPRATFSPHGIWAFDKGEFVTANILLTNSTTALKSDPCMYIAKPLCIYRKFRRFSKKCPMLAWVLGIFILSEYYFRVLCRFEYVNPTVCSDKTRKQ